MSVSYVLEHSSISLLVGCLVVEDDKHYKNTDVFLFPNLYLTQLLHGNVFEQFAKIERIFVNLS
jgi:hypothetical protein